MMRRGIQALTFLFAATWSLVHAPQVHAQKQPGDAAQIKKGSTDADWPAHGGTNSAWRYSALDQINTSNVKNLKAVWSFQTGDYQNGLESSPIVVDGVIFISTIDDVFALDGATGDLIWQYNYSPLPGLTKGRNFGVAVGDGKVFLGTHDDHVVALDQKTGKEVWKVAEADGSSCGRCGIQAAPLIVNDKVIVGAAGYPGRLTAFDMKTGHMVWRFNMIPKPGEPGHETWPDDDSWKRGGINIWQTGSFDPDLNLVYWGTGDCCGIASRGDTKFGDLYEDSILALDADTGKLRWHYQEIPHDTWDLDASWELLLMDRPVSGKMRKLVVQFAKAGFTFAWDRETGELLAVYPYAKTNNWVKDINAKGELIGRNDPPLGKTTKICPSEGGAKNWNQVAYSPRTQLAYLPVVEMCNDLTLSPMPNVPPTFVFTAPPNGPAYTHLDAVDPVTGKVAWTYPYKYQIWTSMMATAGDLMVTGDPEGHAFALDARTGKELWKFQTGSGVHGNPVTYMVRGRQYIAIPTGSGVTDIMYNSGVWPEAGKWRLGSTLFVFALPEESK
jgi:alcohol dehydrogenase (cytochrome c)